MVFQIMFSLIPLLVGTKDSIVAQPVNGPGGAEYQHEEVIFQDFAEAEDGYWLFLPSQPTRKTAPVIVFNHGYGAYNPMIYGQWLRHLVRKGNIVIYPRYQKNLISPKPDEFAKNVATAIQDALLQLDTSQQIQPILDHFTIVGHSYGGVIAADLAANYKDYNIPKPKAVMLCAPGTGFLKGGRLDSYENLPENLKLVIVAEDDDHVVGDEFAKLVFETATNTPNRNLIYHFEDKNKDQDRKIGAKHNECYGIDEAFDTGVRNITALRASRWDEVNEVDYYCYWKLLDALLDCTRHGKNCSFAFGGSPEQKYMGEWSEGNEIKPLKVILPPN
jgi:predicted esterase